MSQLLSGEAQVTQKGKRTTKGATGVQEKNKYDGDLDPKTKKRHGTGKYYYDNPFFMYEGEWNQGVKHGGGALKMADGGSYEGEFVEGEMMGAGKMTWPDGSYYEGTFYMGEKHGEGDGYNARKKERYTGQWELNAKCGKGRLVKEDSGVVIEGDFKADRPHGTCTIINEEEGYSYEGAVQMGLPYGWGVEKVTAQDFIYEGDYVKGLKHGKGRLSYLKAKLTYEGAFIDDKPEYLPNKFLLFQDQNEQTQRVEGLKYDVGGPPLTFKFEEHYQGPEILDPKQPTPEEIEEATKQIQVQLKKNPKKAAEFQAQIDDLKKPKMILPASVKVSWESGRVMRLELIKEEEGGKITKFRVDYREDLRKKREENVKAKEELERLAKEAAEAAQQGKPTAKKGDKKPGKQPVQQAPPQEDLDRANIYKEDEDEASKPLEIVATFGDAYIKTLEFPDNFPAGTYKLQVSDASAFIPFPLISTASFELVITNPLLGQPPKGGAKKK